ncbi:MAG: response regulator [Proteobacteria bacterium]|nr:response regulator [Pseudomonadota bacterium]
MIEGTNILIVDDNNDITCILSDFFLLNDCNVYTAPTGKKAIELIGKENIDVAILDVKLPDINGIELLDTIKIENQTVAVIMMSGYNDHNAIIEAMKKGASDFLLKPFELDKLILVMLRTLRERSLLIENEHIYKSLEDKKKIELLNRELQGKIKELTMTYNISNRFNSLNIYDDIYEKMLDIIFDVLDVRLCRFYFFDSCSKEPILYKEKRGSNGVAVDSKTFLSEEFLQHLHTPKKCLIRDNQLFLPIMIKDEYIGFVMVERKRNGSEINNYYHDSDVFFLKLIGEKASTQIENRILYESLFENVFQTLTSLIEAINKRDSYTESHCKRVTDTSLLLAEKMGLAGYERDVIRFVGPVHDLGKIGIPDSILLKPGVLTEEEYQIMKSHSIFGEEILSRFVILARESKVIRSHHERYDGKGYPDALSKEDIPVSSRVIAVCDTFDAMTTNRPYRNAMKRQDALNEIKRCANSQFDPSIVECFITMMENDTDDRD